MDHAAGHRLVQARWSFISKGAVEMLGLKFHLIKFADDRQGATLFEYAVILFIALALLSLL